MIRDLHRVLDLVESGFQRYRVLVVGDLMLDQYLWGDVSRISPEAPCRYCGRRGVRMSPAAPPMLQ